MTDDYSNSVRKNRLLLRLSLAVCVYLYTHFRKAWFLLCKFPLFQVTEDSDVGHPSVLYLPPLRHTVSLLNKWEEFSFLFLLRILFTGILFLSITSQNPFFFFNPCVPLAYDNPRAHRNIGYNSSNWQSFLVISIAVICMGESRNVGLICMSTTDLQFRRAIQIVLFVFFLNQES